MNSVKFTVIFAAVGFLLSLVIGLFSPVSVPILFLRAFIFAAVFAVLAFLVQIVFQKFMPAVQDEQESVAGSAPAGEAKTTGSVVDITLPDEELPREEHAPNFYVGSNYQMLQKEDFNSRIGNASTETATPTSINQNTENQNVQNVEATTENETVSTSAENSSVASEQITLSQENENASATVTSSPNDVPQQNNSSSQKTIASDDGLLDELPNIDSIVTSTNDEAEEILEDTDFSRVGGKTNFEKKSSALDNVDAVLAAKAISTALANDLD